MKKILILLLCITLLLTASSCKKDANTSDDDENTVPINWTFYDMNADTSIIRSDKKIDGMFDNIYDDVKERWKRSVSVYIRYEEHIGGIELLSEEFQKSYSEFYETYGNFSSLPEYDLSVDEDLLRLKDQKLLFLKLSAKEATADYIINNCEIPDIGSSLTPSSIYGACTWDNETGIQYFQMCLVFKFEKCEPNDTLSDNCYPMEEFKSWNYNDIYSLTKFDGIECINVSSRYELYSDYDEG